MSADEELAAYAARLRALGGAAEDAARIAAPRVAAAIQATASAGTTPDGTAWRAKKDGTRALANAAGAISAVAEGAVVLVKLVGAYVYHNGMRGKSRRQILPDGKGPPPKEVLRACKDAFSEACRRLMRR